MSIAGQKIVIMGGSSGIGLATAKRLAESGCRVTVTGRDAAKLDAVRRDVPGIDTAAMDARDRVALAEFFQDIGAFDHLVLALSGGLGGGPFAGLDLAALRGAFEGKFWAQVTTAQIALKTIRRDGSITFVTAASARKALPGTAGLGAINGALNTLVPTLAVELKPLRVNAVSPGVIETPWWDKFPEAQRKAAFAQAAASAPVGRTGRAEDVADAIAFVIGNGFVTGNIVDCDGGAHVA